MPAAPLTADESAALVAAMLELAEAGDHDAAEHLGELAQDPDAVRKILAGGDDDESGAGARTSDDAPGD